MEFIIYKCVSSLAQLETWINVEMDIKNLKPNPTGKYRQGYFIPTNPEKYVGDPNKIIYRSEWERKFCNWCNAHPNIKKWGSEPLAIPYLNPCKKFVNNQFIPGVSNYYVDFYIVVEKAGIEEKWIIEIKPNAQIPTSKHIADLQKLLEGNRTEKKTIRYNQQLKTLLINKAKFTAAKQFALEHGCQFAICDENFLF